MLVDVGAERRDPGLRFDRLGARMRCGDGVAERVGERVVDFTGQVVERALFVEPLHLDRPFDGRTVAADRERAVGFVA